MPGMTNLRTLLWIYLVLLIFEGALRKWVLPMLDAPLLVIRDPLVLWIYLQAVHQRYSFRNAFFMPNLVLAVATTFFSIFGSGNALITIYGIRTDFLQIPLLFLMPQILNRDDVIAMGKFLFYVSIPCAVLVVLQFRSPPGSFLNKGTLATHYGTVRPSAFFSFITGLVSFYSLVAAFLFYGFIHVRTYAIWLLAAVTGTVMIATACSGSRSCLVGVGLVAAVALLCVVVRGKGGMGIVIAAVLVALAVAVLSATSVFQDASDQLTRRFVDVGVQENGAQGFIARFFDSMLGPLKQVADAPLFGNGLGIDTNAAAGMLRGGREFIGPENEWGRLIYECGPILGLLLCIFRVALTIAVGRRAYAALRHDNILPLLIFASSGLLLLNGQWGQPTMLGFAIFGGGLVLAACEEPWDEEEHEHDEHDDHHDHGEHDEDGEHGSGHSHTADSVD
jgi:hypothetical protein